MARNKPGVAQEERCETGDMRILIADDEDYTREGLIASIGWDEFGIDEVMQAANGQEALKIVNNYREAICVLSVMFEQHHLEELLAASVAEQIMYLEAADGTLLAANVPEEDLPRMPLGERRLHDDSFSPGRLGGEQHLLCSRMMEATNVYLVSVVSESALQQEVASVSMRLQIIYVLISLAGLAAVIPLARSITKRIFLLQAQMMRIQTGVISKLEIADHYDDEIGRLVTHYNEMVDKMGDLLQEQYALGQMKTEAELKALQSQINPHFLYNTLEMINWMAQKDEIDNIQNVVQAMSKSYRLTLSRGHDIVTIGDEIRMCDAYMEIQKRRYRGKILYQVEIDEDINRSRSIWCGGYPLQFNGWFVRLYRHPQC